MKKMMIVMAMVVGLLMSGCASQKTWVACGGSKADGTIKLMYEFGLFQNPILEQGQGEQLATEKCSLWGYKNAVPFGVTTKKCTQWDRNLGCTWWQVFAEFQCTD